MEGSQWRKPLFSVARARAFYSDPSATNAQWFQIVKTRHKISPFNVISRVFPNNFQQIYNYFRFRGMSFILKTCQIVAGASMIHQFHEFFEFIFGGFLNTAAAA